LKSELFFFKLFMFKFVPQTKEKNRYIHQLQLPSQYDNNH